MKLNKHELVMHLGLEGEESQRLYSMLDIAMYTNPFVSFCASNVGTDDMEVCKSTVNWIKSSRRYTEGGSDAMNGSVYKITKTVEKLQTSDSKYDTFVFGFIDLDSHDFNSAIIVKRSECTDSIVGTLVERVREMSASMYASSKYSKICFHQEFLTHFNANKRYAGVEQAVVAHLEKHRSVIEKVERQIDLLGSDMRFGSFFVDYLLSVDDNEHSDNTKDQYKMLDELFKLRVITMMFNYKDVNYSDIHEVCKVIDPSGMTNSYEELVASHGSDIGVIFEFDIMFIKGFRLI